MSRRRKNEVDPIKAILLLFIVAAGFGSYKLTSSFVAVGLAIGGIIGIYIAVNIILIRQRSERLKQSGIAEVDKMNGRQFELFLGHLFREHGYQTEVTQSIGDYGADLVLTKSDRKVVVQAKRYNSRVGVKAIQEIYTAKNHYGASEAWVVTNSDYTQQANSLAKSNDVKLIDREKLIELILTKNKPFVKSDDEKVVAIKTSNLNPLDDSKAVTHSKDECPECGFKLVKRDVSKGSFYVCSDYLKCKYKVKI